MGVWQITASGREWVEQHLPESEEATDSAPTAFTNEGGSAEEVAEEVQDEQILLRLLRWIDGRS